MESQTKITLKIYEPLLINFDDEVKRLCLKRDAFLNRMLKVETPRLAEELKGLRQSGKARRYSSGALKRLGVTKINVVVEKSTASQLKDLVSDANVSRDAFANCMLWFLVASKDELKIFDLPTCVTPSEFKDWYEPMPTGPLNAITEIMEDPLRYLHQASVERHDVGLYRFQFWKDFHGFNVFMTDDDIPGTAEYAASLQRTREQLNALLEQRTNLSLKKTSKDKSR